MRVLESYKCFPRKGEVVRIYEFRGRYHANIDASENVEPSALDGSKLKYILVLAENLPDAVVYVQKHSPLFFPDRVLYLAKIQVRKVADDSGRSE